MKKVIIKILFLVLLSTNFAYSITPTYELKVKNFILTAPSVLEFDIYIKFTNPTQTTFEYSIGQYVFTFNTAFANGGTLSYTYSSSPAQTDFPNLAFVPQNPVILGNQLRLGPSSPQDPGFGFNIPDPGTTDGIKIVRMKLTTSTICGFAGSINNLGLSWRTVNDGGYFTKVISYDLALSNPAINITSSNLANYVIDYNYNGPNNVSIGANKYYNLGHAFGAINSGTYGTGGNLQVNINNNTTEQTSAVLNGSMFNSCSIKPTVNATVTANGTCITDLIILDAADNVTIDGRVGGTGSIQLTLDGNNIAQSCIKFINGASNNNVKYIHSIKAVDKNIFLAETNSAGNNNNIFENNFIENGNRGISLTGFSDISTGTMNTNNKILFNEVKNIKESGIHASLNTQNNTIEGNQVHIESASTASIFYAINCQGTGTNNILRNKVYKIKSNGANTDYFGIRSVPLGNVPATINIINNFVSIVDDNSDSICGIYCGSDISPGYVKQTTSVNHNTVYIGKNSNSSLTATTGIKMNFTGVAGNESTYNQFNNISINERDTSINTEPQEACEILKHPAVIINADYNCYWTNKTITRWNTFSYRNLPEYQCAADPNEQNSIFKDVNFVNEIDGDLHLNITSIGDYDLISKTGLGIMNDFDDAFPYVFVRSTTAPYMGADESAIFNLYGMIRIRAYIDGIPLPNKLPVNATIEIRDNNGTTYPHLTGSPFNITYTTSGTITINCPAAVNQTSGSFYIVIIRPGCLDTWSKVGGETMSTIPNTYLNYDFTTTPSQAFCDNMKPCGCKSYIFNGDVNSDSKLDPDDHGHVVNDALNAIECPAGVGNGQPTGGRFTDINCDGIVDCKDIFLSDENQTWWPVMSNIPIRISNDPLNLTREFLNRPAGLYNGAPYNYYCDALPGFCLYVRPQ